MTWPKCSIRDCDNPRQARGLCNMHYKRARKSGSLQNLVGKRASPPTRPREERFWAKVAKAGKDECWPWNGAFSTNGYGQLRTGDRLEQASRVSYEIAHGVGPGDSEVCHSCDTPACVNPSHLFLGDRFTNMGDAKAKGRTRNQNSTATHCWRGHPLSGPNLYVAPGAPYRHCRECRQIRDRARRSKR